jgi:hypothetical protein
LAEKCIAFALKTLKADTLGELQVSPSDGAQMIQTLGHARTSEKWLQLTEAALQNHAMFSPKRKEMSPDSPQSIVVVTERELVMYLDNNLPMRVDAIYEGLSDQYKMIVVSLAKSEDQTDKNLGAGKQAVWTLLSKYGNKNETLKKKLKAQGSTRLSV